MPEDWIDVPPSPRDVAPAWETIIVIFVGLLGGAERLLGRVLGQEALRLQIIENELFDIGRRGADQRLRPANKPAKNPQPR